MGCLRRLGVAAPLVGALLVAMAACDADPPTTEPGRPERATGAPRSSITPAVVLLPTPSPPVPLDRCPVTRGTALTEPRPTALPVGPIDHWYGTGPLWVDLSLLPHADSGPVGPNGGHYRVRWKAFVDGQLTARIHRLDGTGQGRVRVYAAYAEQHAFWTGEVWLPTAGCWLVTASVDRVSLSFVMRTW
jgi:hypothetical protein